MPNDIAKLMSRKACIDDEGHVMKPEFGFLVSSTNVHVSGLVSFV